MGSSTKCRESSSSCFARRHEQGAIRASLTATERVAIVARMDAGTATKVDWDLWNRDLGTRLA